MKKTYYNRVSAKLNAALTLVLPIQMLPVTEGESQPQDIEVEDICNLCVRYAGVGESGIGKPIGTEGATRYELQGSEIIVTIAPVELAGEISVIISGKYGQVGLYAKIVTVVGASDTTEIELAPYIFAAIGGGGGGADYKTDVYMDGDGRVVVERLEDGSTVILDEHENPILKRNPDGTTEIYDAFQSVRQGVTPHGNMWLNMPTDGQFAVNGAMTQGASGNVASGANAHAEGYGCQATGAASHAEGTATVASGQGSHAEGSSSQTKTCEASGENSHAEGLSCVASGKNSHAEGHECTASGNESHAEGLSCIASGYAAHAEGNSCQATDNTTHAEGFSTRATNWRAHAEGSRNTASGIAAHAEGESTLASEISSHAQGVYNNPEGGAYAFMHGCGTSNADRRNAFLIAGDEVYVYGVGGYDGTNYGQEGVQSLRQVLTAIQVKLINF